MKIVRIRLVVVLILVAGRTFNANAQVVTNLYSFGSSASDGAGPYATLAQGSDGNFYGTTSLGGTSTNCASGCGTVFRISPSGSYTNLYSFGISASDGTSPYASLLLGNDGNLYENTERGHRIIAYLQPPSHPFAIFSARDLPCSSNRCMRAAVDASL